MHVRCQISVLLMLAKVKNLQNLYRLVTFDSRGDAVSEGSVLQAGRSRDRFPMVLLEILLT
jgi:hypothetical protein